MCVPGDEEGSRRMKDADGEDVDVGERKYVPYGSRVVMKVVLEEKQKVRKANRGEGKQANRPES